MRKSIHSTFLAGGLALVAGAVFAGEPKPLSDAQMDSVSAGAIGVVAGFSGGAGDLLNLTQINQGAIVVGGAAAAAGSATNVSASLLFPAASTSGQTVFVSN